MPKKNKEPDANESMHRLLKESLSDETFRQLRELLAQPSADATHAMRLDGVYDRTLLHQLAGHAATADPEALQRCCELLIRHGAQPQAKDSKGLRPADLPGAEALEPMLNEELARYEQAGERLLAAAEVNDLRALRPALHGAGAAFADGDGMTALHWACIKGHVEAAAALLEHEVSSKCVQVADARGYSPVHCLFPLPAAHHAQSSQTEISAERRFELLELLLSHEPACLALALERQSMAPLTVLGLAISSSAQLLTTGTVEANVASDNYRELLLGLMLNNERLHSQILSSWSDGGKVDSGQLEQQLKAAAEAEAAGTPRAAVQQRQRMMYGGTHKVCPFNRWTPPAAAAAAPKAVVSAALPPTRGAAGAGGAAVRTASNASSVARTGTGFSRSTTGSSLLGGRTASSQSAASSEFSDYSEGSLELEGDEYDDFASDDDDLQRTESVAQVLDADALFELRAKLLTDLGELSGAPEIACAKLLGRTCDWSLENATRVWFDGSEALLQEMGEAGAADGVADVAEEEEEEALCGVCYGEADDSNPLLGCACGHLFCSVCWKVWIADKVQEANVLVPCPLFGDGCLATLPTALLHELCPPELQGKLRRFIVRSFVKEHHRVKWCPRAGCELAVMATSGAQSSVRCACSNEFCFQCGEEAHFPVSCAMLQQWTEKNLNDSQTFNWIKANTQACPKCKNAINKNGGCSHMTCRPPGGCGHEFCWLCLGDYRTHTTCNKFNADKQQQEADSARSKLDKYLHYFNRWNAHQLSRQHEEKAVATAVLQATEQLDALDKLNATAVQQHMQEGLVDAARSLVAARHKLQYTYAYAYYLKSGTDQEQAEKNLFEYLQAELEIKVEALSEEMEHPKLKDGLPRREKALAMSTQIDSAMAKLHDGVSEGGLTVHADLMAAAGAEAWDRTVERGGYKPDSDEALAARLQAKEDSALERMPSGL